MASAGRVAVQLVGREPELAALGEFLAPEEGRRALILTGEAGIGKTSLWEAGIATAQERGIRVLSTQASGAEAKLLFAGLVDLLDGVDLDGLPAPQRRALEVALLRAEPGGRQPSSEAIAVGFLNTLRELAKDRPVLIAIDDVPWLDAPSADAVAFAARRLKREAVGFLLARRPGRASQLERALEPGLDRLAVAPLSLGAIRRLLSERLDLAISRHLLRKIVDATLGNPLFVLELGREMSEHGQPQIGDDLPMPDAVEHLLGTRLSRLAAPIRRLLLAAALSSDLSASQLAALAGTASVEDAVDAGLLVVDGSRVRASHPLLAAMVRKRSNARTRRRLHLELAKLVGDDELRARHLALGTERPDGALAAVVATAAAGTFARGARQDAVELAAHALRLTPQDAFEHGRRVLELAGYLEVAGEPRRATDLLLVELDGLVPGEARVRALLMLAECHGRAGADANAYLDRALAESGGDPVLRAHVLPAMAQLSLLSDVRNRERLALESLPAARRAGPDVERQALDALGWARVQRGLAIDHVCKQFHAATAAAGYVAASPDRPAAQRLAWRGEVTEARKAHLRLQSTADERGEALSSSLQRLHLCELDLRIGNCAAAAQFLDEWDEGAHGALLPLAIYERCHALLAACRGLPREVEERATKAITLAKACDWNWLEASRARGVGALLAHDPTRATESLRAVWEHTEREGIEECGLFPVAPDLVEALMEIGKLSEARAVTERLRGLAEEQEHPWGLATANRCTGLVALAAGSYPAEAAALLAAAADAFAGLGLPFDRARSLLLLGRAQRRHRKWGAARDSLERAAAAFEELGSTGWTDEARSELERVGARRPAPEGGLSPAELGVAKLARDGLSNKEIAQELFVSVKTVETHLSRVYAKVGVRSRSQLAAHWSSRA